MEQVSNGRCIKTPNFGICMIQPLHTLSKKKIKKVK